MPNFPNKEITYIFEDVRNDSIYPSASSYGEFIASYLDGMLTTENLSSVFSGLKRLSQDGDERITIAEARASVGEWMGIFEGVGDSGAYLVAADPFGYQPVFYREANLPGGGRALLVSNSFRSICAQAKSLGAKNQLEWGEFFSLIGTPHAWSITMQSHQTLEASTFVLLPGEEIEVSGTSWAVKNTDFFDAGDGDYQTLLERGIAKSVSQLRAATRMPVDQRKIFLSGGRDSRMAISLLAAAGVVNDYSVSTVNPATWTPASARPGLYRDLFVANTIREAFGMDWSDHQPAIRVPLVFQESLEFWQSNRSHKNFRFKAPQSLTVSNCISSEIRGAAGETFRGFQAVKTLKSYRRFGADPNTFEQDVTILSDELFGDGLLTGESLALAKDAISVSLEKTGGDNIIDALHRRYSVYRNRSHFGHVKASMSTGQIPILPLSQPEFVRAATLLTEQERYDNLMAFDIIETAFPDLNTLEYDSGAYPASQRFESSSKKRWNVVEKGSGIEAYREKEEEGALLRAEALRDAKKVPPFDPRFVSQNQLKELFIDLSQTPGGSEWLPYPLQVKFFQSIESRRLNPLTLLSKFETAKEAFGEEGNYPAIVVKQSPRFHDRVPVLRANEDLLPEAVEQPAFRVDLQVEENRVEFQVVAKGRLRRPLNYHARLLSEAGAIAKIDLGSSGKGQFPELHPGEKYRIQFFSYYENEKMVPFKFFSRFFQLKA